MKAAAIFAGFASFFFFQTAMALAGPGDSSGPEKKANSGAIVQEVIEAHNRERIKANLKPLTIDPKLTAAAQAHADDMAAHHKMTHDGSDGSTPSDRIKRQDYHFQNDGENVAEGYKTSDSLMQGWMNSEHHRENILGKFTQIGIAVAYDDDKTPYWSADFGTPWETLDPAQAAEDLVKAINKERVSAKLPALTSRAKLQTAAMQLAHQFAEADSFDLKGKGDDLVTIINRLKYRYRRLAESAASGQPDVSEVVKTWTESPAHKDYLLGDFREVGIGYATSASGKPYWTLVLAKPLKN